MSDELTRKKGIGCLVAGVALMALNHYLITTNDSTFQILAIGGPAFATLGIAGTVEPRIMEAMDKAKRADYPTSLFVAGILATIVGVGIGFGLSLGFYGLEL